MKENVKLNTYSYEQVSLKEILFFAKSPCNLFSQNNLFTPFIYQGQKFSKKILLELAGKKRLTLLCRQEDLYLFHLFVKKEVTEVCKKFSHGSPTQNALRLLNLYLIHQKRVYSDPFNKEMLQDHHQITKLITEVITNYQKYTPEIFNKFSKIDHYYLDSQPIKSTLIFSHLLEESKVFEKKFNQSLFITSLFKDIGMSLIDKSILESKNISEVQKKEINHHSDYSYLLCKESLHLSTTQLNLIKHHHDIKSEKILFGPELIFLHFSDVLSAMISDRPYRSRSSLYKALELIKHSTPPSNKDEFKFLVNFSTKFFNI